MRRPYIRTATLLCFALVAASIAASCSSHKGGISNIDQLPINETVNLPGLDGAVDVVRDEFGRPHIYATTLHDLAEVTGWVHTEDRFIQMDLQRREASSRLAELVGAASASAVDVDRQFHAYGLNRAAQKIYDALPAGSDAKVALDAYTVGVNAKMATYTDANPPAVEYQIFEYPFTQSPPWTSVDSLSVGRLLAFQLAWDGDEKVGYASAVAGAQAAFTTGAMAGFTTDTFLHFTPPETVAIVNPTISPNLRQAPIHPAALSHLPSSSLQQAKAVHDLLKDGPFGYLFSHPGQGSNDWVVSGALTATHHPMLANDPHLSFQAPPIWYELHWSTVKSGGDIDVSGVSLPGVPAIILGGNGRVAWGVTNVGAEVTDLYVEHYSIGTGTNGVDQVQWSATGTAGQPTYMNLVADTASIVVRSSLTSTTTVKDVIWFTPQRNGVIVPGSLVVNTAQSLVTGTALSWAWTGFYATNEINVFYDLMRAKTAADVYAADLNFDVPAQNMVYADSSGNIGYVAAGWYPIRNGDLHQFPPYLPMPGFDGGHEWTGRLSSSQYPQEANPARGWVASANQDPIGTTYEGDPTSGPFYLGALDWDPGFRGGRISRELQGMAAGANSDGRLVIAGNLSELQADVFSNYGNRMLAFLLPAITNTYPNEASLLAGWGDAGNPAESGVGTNLTSDDLANSAATCLFNAWLVAVRNRTFADKEARLGFQIPDQVALVTMLFALEHPTEAATYDAAHDQSAIWDDTTTPQVETWPDLASAAMGDAVAFLESPAGFGTSNQNDWIWGNLHTVNFPRLSQLSSYDIPEGVDHADFPNGYPRHGDVFDVDQSTFGLTSGNYTYNLGPSMREVIDLTPGHMNVINALPGGMSADPSSPHYSDRAELWAQNLAQPTWYLESDVAGHSTNREHFQN